MLILKPGTVLSVTCVTPGAFDLRLQLQICLGPGKGGVKC